MFASRSWTSLNNSLTNMTSLATPAMDESISKLSKDATACQRLGNRQMVFSANTSTKLVTMKWSQLPASGTTNDAQNVFTHHWRLSYWIHGWFTRPPFATSPSVTLHHQQRLVGNFFWDLTSTRHSLPITSSASSVYLWNVILNFFSKIWTCPTHAPSTHFEQTPWD